MSGSLIALHVIDHCVMLSYGNQQALVSTMQLVGEQLDGFWILNDLDRGEYLQNNVICDNVN